MWLLSVTKTWWLMSGIEVFVTLTGGYTVETLTGGYIIDKEVAGHNSFESVIHFTSSTNNSISKTILSDNDKMIKNLTGTLKH